MKKGKQEFSDEELQRMDEEDALRRKQATCKHKLIDRLGRSNTVICIYCDAVLDLCDAVLWLNEQIDELRESKHG